MIKDTEFRWRIHKVNNIETNPLEEWYCIIDVGDTARKYGIVPQYPTKNGITLTEEEPEYYILFEAIGHKATDEDRKNYFYDSIHFNNYIFNAPSFIRVFTNIELAKRQAYIQYKAIYDYALSYIVDDIEESTKKHFVI